MSNYRNMDAKYAGKAYTIDEWGHFKEVLTWHIKESCGAATVVEWIPETKTCVPVDFEEEVDKVYY